MPFIKIATGRSWTHGGQKYEGVQEVAPDVAQRAGVVAARFEWDWLTVHEDRPADDEVNPSARAGKLTMDDIKLGTAGAAAAATAATEAEIAEAARAAAAAVAAAADVNATPKPFPCDHEDCGMDFPSKSALKRHKTMNHKPEVVETAAATAETPAPAAADVAAAGDDTAPQGDENAATVDAGDGTAAADDGAAANDGQE